MKHAKGNWSYNHKNKTVNLSKAMPEKDGKIMTYEIDCQKFGINHWLEHLSHKVYLDVKDLNDLRFLLNSIKDKAGMEL